jgi:hypothetical protein
MAYQSLFPAKQLLIVGSEEFMRDSTSVLKEVFAFLEIDPEQNITDLQFQNQGSNKQGVPKEVYTGLNAFFAEPNKRLFEHLGKPFDWPSP